MKITSTLGILTLTSTFLAAGASAQTTLPEGTWRGVFHQQNADVPFNFETKGKKAAAKLYLINGEERFEASSITQKGDSVFVAFDQFDNELALKIADKKLSGVLRKKDQNGRTTAIDATFGETFRFADNGEKPLADISGKYEVVFKSRSGAEDKKVGLFQQKGSKLYATFLSITGDSRYLEGVVQGSKFYLSSFIGSGAAYYTGYIGSDGKLNGTASGQPFTATKSEAAALPDPYKLTYLKEGYTSFDFSLPDVDGKKISLKDPKYKNKVTIVTITGTWCPNCIDEANFLAPWYKKNKTRGVEAIAVHYERKLDPEYLKTAIGSFKKRYGVEYDEVIGGLVDKKAVAESFPALNAFLSFPTILFIDKKGDVAKIYTGFTGPATGEYYTRFVKEFNDEVDRLLKEPAI
ncbi:peroxiredoxin family protein [Mucilaginibacter myungsuensis]|uniref:TlpA family protein disulfide reductase n=1 Tax=Mucilaginibacter myungsuensis TaxID=649104 RepID=A0A929PXJ2_9SPHI|nr:TlpA disulfide reductase family protein [Mucilaginibacter myungsuensis]MBE9663918.1 TlpA family protein disulfide reductase [Mucilaginibacter myungsuensis]MDN3598366.1 TlpA disulfide reductase family protein [Mucilaginibacter myungsuensis]